MGKGPPAAKVRPRSWYIAALVSCLVLSCRGPDTGGAARGGDRLRRPDVILVTIDTLRADRVGIAGGPAGETAALDALGRTGAVFLDATAHAPLTLPSHASILTGRYPVTHGVHDNGGFTLGDDVPTLASLLHDAGYHTAAFVSSFVVRAGSGLSRGFDAYDDRFEAAGRAHQTAGALERRGTATAREAARWLASAPRPYLLWVHFYDPHTPYDPPPAFASKFPGRPYDGEVAASDFALSMVLNALPPDRRAETIVVVTGDHGESLGEHGESEHGILLYDATLHVPLVIAGAGVPAGVRVSRQVRHVDLVPTIAELAGVQVPAGVDGVSLVALLGSDPIRKPYGVRPLTNNERGLTPGDAPASYAESRFGELHFGWSPLRSLRDGQWKYIDSPDPELFQLTADPGERDNRRAARADTAAGMARALADLRARETGPPASAAADPQVSERLRSLGYVSGRVALGQARPAGRPGQAGQAGNEDPKREIARYEAYVTAFNDGLASLESGRAAEAERAFRQLARAFPLAFEPHQYLARALAARRATRDAAAEFDLAIRLSPREPVLYFDAARTLADGAQFDRAFARAAEGRRLEPASYYGALTEGIVARAAGQPDRAERAFREAVELNPNLSVAHLELGQLAEARGDRQAARVEYRRALDGDATLTAARDALERLAR